MKTSILEGSAIIGLITTWLQW